MYGGSLQKQPQKACLLYQIKTWPTFTRALKYPKDSSRESSKESRDKLLRWTLNMLSWLRHGRAEVRGRSAISICPRGILNICTNWGDPSNRCVNNSFRAQTKQSTKLEQWIEGAVGGGVGGIKGIIHAWNFEVPLFVRHSLTSFTFPFLSRTLHQSAKLIKMTFRLLPLRN